MEYLTKSLKPSDSKSLLASPEQRSAIKIQIRQRSPTVFNRRQPEAKVKFLLFRCKAPTEY